MSAYLSRIITQWPTMLKPDFNKIENLSEIFRILLALCLASLENNYLIRQFNRKLLSKRIFMKTLFLALLLTLINSLSLAKDIGTISFLRGNAWIIRGQDKISAQKDFILQSKDEVLTEKRTLMKVTLQDRSLFSIGPSSHIHFKNFNLNSTPKDPSLFQLTHGFLRAKFAEKERMGEIQIETQHISMAIRGTELIVEQYESDQKPQTNVVLLSGKIQVFEKETHGQRRSFFMQPGFRFSSQSMQEKGFMKAAQKVEVDRLNQLKRHPSTFLFDLNKKGKSYPDYQTPKRFQNLREKRSPRDSRSLKQRRDRLQNHVEKKSNKGSKRQPNLREKRMPETRKHDKPLKASTRSKRRSNQGRGPHHRKHKLKPKKEE